MRVRTRYYGSYGGRQVGKTLQAAAEASLKGGVQIAVRCKVKYTFPQEGRYLIIIDGNTRLADLHETVVSALCTQTSLKSEDFLEIIKISYSPKGK